MGFLEHSPTWGACVAGFEQRMGAYAACREHGMIVSRAWAVDGWFCVLYGGPLH
jgi:hypothetical protein